MSEDILELDGIQTGVLFLRVAGSQNISRLTLAKCSYIRTHLIF